MTKQHVCQAAFGKITGQDRIRERRAITSLSLLGLPEQSGRLRCHSLGGGFQALGVQIKTALALAPLGLRSWNSIAIWSGRIHFPVLSCLFHVHGWVSTSSSLGIVGDGDLNPGWPKVLNLSGLSVFFLYMRSTFVQGCQPAGDK